MSTLGKFFLTGKVVVVTGGAGLIGKEHVIAILEAGGVPVILDSSEDGINGAKLYFGDKVLALKTDITKEELVVQAFDAIKSLYGVPYALINNAAIDPKVKHEGLKDPSRLEEFSVPQWDKEISVGLTGSMICTKIFGTAMAEKKTGVILNVSSDLGIIAPDQRIYKKDGAEYPVKPVTYSVIKHGLIGLTKYTATYWASKGVRCNAICPGGVYNGQSDSFMEKLTNLIPMGRMAQVDEYRAAVIFMLSDASSYMTGSVVVLDGGRTCW